MDQQYRKGEFALFLDESGSPKPNPRDSAPFFAMGGVLVERADESTIDTLLAEFKARWAIDPNVPLHGNEIRSQKKRFAWLGKLSETERSHFMDDLTMTVVSCPIIVHACVVSRTGYLNRYLNKYGENTWEMMKSAFSILVERAAKYATTREGTVMLYFEKAGKKEDKLLEHYFGELRSAGLPFDPKTSSKYSPMPTTELSRLLRGIEGKSKSNPLIQLADLCLYPVARSISDPSNRAFSALRDSKLLVDCLLESTQVETLGIKYYCFDNT